MEQKIKLLLCDADETQNELTKEYLEERNFCVDIFLDGESALHGFIQKEYDICVLETSLPRKDGYSIAQKMKIADSRIPLVFLSKKTSQPDIIAGFKVGADDYICKPYILEELVLRIKAIIKRIQAHQTITKTIYNIGRHFIYDAKMHMLFSNQKQIQLTRKESKLLYLFCTHADHTLERNYVLKTMWTDNNYHSSRCLNAYVVRLRRYMRDDPSIEFVNMYGKGYKMIINNETLKADSIYSF